MARAHMYVHNTVLTAQNATQDTAALHHLLAMKKTAIYRDTAVTGTTQRTRHKHRIAKVI
eukprot:m.62743 g.62743  ORF g.62743 m.62743 type:complete len:60 (-) comp15811_c0_seq1:106-285(-)